MKETSKEKLLKRIEKIKTSLEAESRRFGWIKDKRGMRYLPTDYYMKMEDYAEGLNYLKWFHKNFPKDRGFPEFLLECTIIHFKNGNLKEARYKAFDTLRSNYYVFDKYFGKEITPVEIFQKNDNESAEYTKFIHFTSGDLKMADFDQWLQELVNSKKFQEIAEKFVEIRQILLYENDSASRAALNKEEANLKYKLD